jgi:hypothetical protein
VNKPKIAVRSARLLYPTKLPRRLFAIEAVTGRERHFAMRKNRAPSFRLCRKKSIIVAAVRYRRLSDPPCPSPPRTARIPAAEAPGRVRIVLDRHIKLPDRSRSAVPTRVRPGVGSVRATAQSVIPRRQHEAAASTEEGFLRTQQLQNAWLIVSRIVLDTFEELKMSYPKTSAKRRRELLSIRKGLAK